MIYISGLELGQFYHFSYVILDHCLIFFQPQFLKMEIHLIRAFKKQILQCIPWTQLNTHTIVITTKWLIISQFTYMNFSNVKKNLHPADKSNFYELKIKTNFNEVYISNRREQTKTCSQYGRRQIQYPLPLINPLPILTLSLSLHSQFTLIYSLYSKQTSRRPSRNTFMLIMLILCPYTKMSVGRVT